MLLWRGLFGAVWREFCSCCHGKVGQYGSFNIDYVVRYLETFNYSSRLCSKVSMVETHGSTSSSIISSHNQFSVEVDAGFDVKKNTIRLWWCCT